MIDIFDKIVSHRRAVRIFDAAKPIDEAKVRHCIELATLAPTSSNMQLWEAYHTQTLLLLQDWYTTVWIKMR